MADQSALALFPEPTADTFVRPGFDVFALVKTMNAWGDYGFACIDRAGGLQLYSQQMATLTGYSSADLLRGGFFDVLFPSARQRTLIWRAVREFLAGGETNRVFHWTIRRKDGVERTMWANSVVTPDGGNERAGLFMSFRDVSDYPGALGYDRATQRGFEELVESAPDIIVRFRPGDGRCVYINRAVETVTGFAPARFYQDAGLWRRLVSEEDLPLFDVAFAEVAAGRIRELDYRLRIKGRHLYLSQKLYPIEDDAGTVFAIEGILRDQSGRIALEGRLNQLLDDKEAVNVALASRMRELEAANEKLRSLDRFKSEILANVSHELRTPLVTLCGYAELLLDAGLGSLTRKQRQALEVMRRSGRRLAGLIENMLEYARLEEGRFILRRERVDLRACVREVADDLGDRLKAKGLAFEVRLPARPVLVRGDRTRLLLLLRNLLGNAEKFTDRGKIEVVVSSAGRQAVLVVADSGIGIAPEHQARIFERFFQVDGSATRRHAGAGLGLAIVREVVETHGGTLSLESRIGGGSRFEIHLPAAANERRRRPDRRRARRRAADANRPCESLNAGR